MGKLITLVVIIALTGGGYFWYNHTKEQKIRAAQIARIELAEKTIAELNTELEKEYAEQPLLLDALNKADLELTACRNKHDEQEQSLRGAEAQLQEAQQVARRATTNHSATTNRQDSEITLITNQISELSNKATTHQKELEKVECHHNCMKRAKPADKERVSDKGYWHYRSTFITRRGSYDYWTCKTHRHQFRRPLEYLDYKRESSRLSLLISQCMTQERELKAALQAEKDKVATQTVAVQTVQNTQLTAEDEWQDAIILAKQELRNAEAEMRIKERIKRDAESKLNDCRNRVERAKRQNKEQSEIIAANRL